jgi:hypothetical protein
VKHISLQIKIEHLWSLIVLVGIFTFINTHPIRPQDFWWHIAIGREVVTTGKIPTTDIYSFTEPGQPYPSYQMFWLMEITLYELYHFGGAALVIFAHSLWITAAYVVIFWICKKTTNSWRIAAFSVLFAAALGLNDWNVRPQAITFLLGSLFLYAVYQYRFTQRWYWLLILPIGMLIWVNSHGTFLIGLALIGIWLGQELWDVAVQRWMYKRKAMLKPVTISSAVLGLTILVCLINPRGAGIVDYIKTLTGNTVVQNLVTEWAAPSLNTYMGVFFFCGLLGTAVLIAISPKRPNFYQISTFIIFGLLGIKTSRGIVWFGLVMAPVVADHLSAIMRHYHKVSQEAPTREGSHTVNILFFSIICLMGVISLPWFKSVLPMPAAKAGLISSETPVQATQFLIDQKLPARIFNSMSFGSYLIWAAYPQYQVFVDTRIELFSEQVWMDYLDISNANGDWESSLSEYGVNTLVLSPSEQSPLILAAHTSKEWKLLYQDNSAFIFTRK